MKTVTYFDKEFQVPDWVEYLAMDDDGEVWGYDMKPRRASDCYVLSNGSKCKRIGSHVLDLIVKV